MEVFDYLDTELRLAETGEKKKKTLPPFPHPTLPRKRNLSYSNGPQPADIIYLCTKSSLKKELLCATPFLPVFTQTVAHLRK